MTSLCSAVGTLVVTILLLFSAVVKASSSSFTSTSTSILTKVVGHQAKGNAKIYYAADDRVKLYINGKFRGQTTSPKALGTLSVPLKAGDVVGMLVNDVGGGYGAIMTIVMPNGVRYRTGRGNFLARKSFKIPGNPLAWSTPEYNACSWLEAAPSSASDSSIAKPSMFPKAMAGAQYVWAKNTGGYTSIIFRIKIGGEMCNTRFGNVFMAADDSARLFVNGKLIAAVNKPTALVQSRHAFKKGDVIGIQARDIGGAYGVITAIITPTMKILTGSGAWRATKAYKMPAGMSQNAWSMPGFSACSWLSPVLAPKGYAVPPSLPIEMNGATYVWAANSEGKSSIYLRYRIGGEACTGKSVRVSFSADDVANLFVDGKLIATNKNPKQVTSVQVQVKKGSVVGIVAKDNGIGYGVVAAVVDGKQKFVTGSPRWRARKAFVPASGYFAWTKPSYKQCFPVAPPTSSKASILKPNVLPAELKTAKYVWAKDAGAKNTIFLRFRYGGGC